MAVSRSSWWIVVGSMLGLIVGNGPVMQFTFGVFLKPVMTELGSDRATVSAALLAGLCLTGIAAPIAGRLIDRFGIRAVALPAIALFAIGIAALGLLVHSVAGFILLYGLLGILSVGQSPLPYARAVTAAFDARRGLALGVSMAGVGLGTALLPPLAQWLVDEFGWRTAYALLGALVFAVAFPAMALLVGTGERLLRGPARDQVAGVSGRGAAGSATFWVLAVAFFCVAMAASGMTAHLIPLLTDRGVSTTTATAAISVAGLALIGGRLLAGYLLDRLFAPYVALAFFFAPLLGIVLLLAAASTESAFVAALLVGAGLGAEVDLIAYLLSRYFGMRAFGEIYGYLFAVFMLGSGVGPFLMGVSFTQTDGYDPALLFFAAALVLACVLMLRLGPYAFGAVPAPATPRTST